MKRMLPAISIAFLSACSNVQPYNDNGEVIDYDETHDVVVTRGALLFRPWGTIPGFGKRSDFEKPLPASASAQASASGPVPGLVLVSVPAPAAVPPVAGRTLPQPVPAALPAVTPALSAGMAPLAVVLFGHASASLSRQAVAAILGELPKIRHSGKVLVRGFADRNGRPDRNLRLSAARARRVAELLAKHGLARQRIVTEALGDRLANAPCPDRAPKAARIRCFAADRRVEILAPG